MLLLGGGAGASLGAQNPVQGAGWLLGGARVVTAGGGRHFLPRGERGK